MPKLYRAPGSTAEAGKSNYLGIRGKDYIFVPAENATRPTGTRFAQIRDGLSNTIAVVEASSSAAVIWTKPDDFEPNDQDLLKGLVGLHAGGFSVGICDGSVQFISRQIDKVTLKAMFTKAGGEPIPIAP
jgi:hypothetical protein